MSRHASTVLRRFFICAVVAGCGVAALFAIFTLSDDGCDGCDDPGRAEFACDALSAQDQNPQDDPIPPVRGRPLLESTGSAPVPFGFNDSAFITGQTDLETPLRLHEEVGSTIWRLPLDWGAVERSQGDFDFASMDSIYCEALDRGVRPLVHLTGIPPWAAAPEAPCTGVPCVQPPASSRLPDLQAFAERVAIRYSDLVAIEAWNEPNLPEFWPAPDPDAYVDVLAAIYAGVKAGNPETPVIGGSLSAGMTDDPATGALALETFLQGMQAAGAERYMDGLSVHPYPTQPLDTPGESFTTAMATTRRFAESASGWPDRLWVTETGIATLPGSSFSAPVSEEEQERTLSGIYERLSGAGDVDAVLFHTLVDPGPAVPGGPGFGWVASPTEALRQKPVFCRFAQKYGLGDC